MPSKTNMRLTLFEADILKFLDEELNTWMTNSQLFQYDCTSNLQMTSSILPHILPEKESLLEAQYVPYLYQDDLCQPQGP